MDFLLCYDFQNSVRKDGISKNNLTIICGLLSLSRSDIKKNAPNGKHRPSWLVRFSKFQQIIDAYS